MNTIDRAEDSLNEIKKDEVVAKILYIKERIESRPVDKLPMHELADYIFTLCKFMDNLSQLKDYAYTKGMVKEDEYKAGVRDKYIEIKNGSEKVTDTMARMKAEQDCHELKQEQIIAEHQARSLRSFYIDLERLISVYQTRVKTQVDSQIRHNIPNN